MKNINDILRPIKSFVKKIVKSISTDAREDAILATLFAAVVYLLHGVFTLRPTIISLLFVWYFAMIIFRIIRQQEQRKDENKNKYDSESIEDLIKYLKKEDEIITEEIQ